MHTIVFIGFFLITVAYLCDLFGQFRLLEPAYQEKEHLALIEHLTKHKKKTKQYDRKPEGFSSFNKKLEGRRVEEQVAFRYEFPLVKDLSSVFQCTLEPVSISADVDSFGMTTSILDVSEKDKTGLLASVPEEEYRARMNRDGWYFRSHTDWGVDYRGIVQRHRNFTSPIAQSIYNDLSSRGLDSKLNRVQAALHFVQFIPYGVPHFDTRDWSYHGLSLPQESFILGYSDCDSKSVFMASLLLDLIPAEDILLISCMVRSSSDRSNGAHMMVAVAGLSVTGESVEHGGRSFLLLETTTPLVMGQADWQELNIVDKISLS